MSLRIVHSDISISGSWKEHQLHSAKMAKIASLALLHVAFAADTVVLQGEDYNVNAGDLSSGEAKHIVIVGWG